MHRSSAHSKNPLTLLYCFSVQVESSRFDGVLLHVTEVDNSACNMLARMVSMLARMTGSRSPVPIDTESRMHDFLKLQATLARNQKGLMVIDGASGLLDKDGISAVEFVKNLPFRMNANLRLLLGVTTGPANLAHPALNQWPLAELLPITAQDQEHLVKRYVFVSA